MSSDIEAYRAYQETQKKEWQDLKEFVYNVDGSVRDIYVLNSTIDDWRAWATYINDNYSLEFNASGVVKDKIDIDHVLKRWNGNEDEWAGARIKLSDTITINVHFSTADTIENDIDPREFNCMEDNYTLLRYMIGLSYTLGKPVLLTAENMEDAVCIRVNGDDVEYC